MASSVADADADRPTIADLEMYGLSIRAINALENGFDIIYVDQLRDVTAKTLMADSRMGRCRTKQLQRALRRFVDGRTVRTPKECISFDR